MAIANPQQKKTFASMFSSRSRRRETENNVHPSLARRKGEDHDFDRMLMARTATKKVSLGREKESSSIWHRERGEPPVSPIKVPLPPNANTSGQTTPTQAMVRKRTKSSNNRHQLHEDGDGEGNKTSFFSKNRVARRVKTNEDNRARARKDREREHEVEFEIHSASGLSSGGNSPNEGNGVEKKKKKGDDDEKWMGRSCYSPMTRVKEGLIPDILIANGAKRMDRQDAVPPKSLQVPGTAPLANGLPPSPRPSPRNLPPNSPHSQGGDHYRPHTHEYQGRDHSESHINHTPELARDRSADDEALSIAPATPRASGFSQSQAQSSPRSSEDQSQVEDPYAHGLARRPSGGRARGHLSV
jgi:hypothetical protein